MLSNMISDMLIPPMSIIVTEYYFIVGGQVNGVEKLYSDQYISDVDIFEGLVRCK